MDIFRSGYHANDFDVYKAWSKENSWDLKTLQLSAGKSRFEIDACQVGDISIWRYFAGARMFDQLSPPPGIVEFTFSYLHEPANWCGFETSQATMVIYRGGQSYYASYPKNMVAYGISMSESTLQQLSLVPARMFSTSIFPEKAIYSRPAQHTGPLLWHIDKLLVDTSQALSMSSIEINEMYEQSVSLLQQVLSVYLEDGNDNNCFNHTSSVRRSTVFFQTCEIFHDKLAEPVNMTEIANLVGCSRRTIEKAFLKTTGLSPYAFLRQQRLHAARNLLQQGSSVLNACLEYGFTNQGRFAYEYNALFGEKPSLTAKQKLRE